MVDFEEHREELLECIRDLLSRKQYTALRDTLMQLDCRCCSAFCRRSRPRRYSWNWIATSRSC